MLPGICIVFRLRPDSQSLLSHLRCGQQVLVHQGFQENMLAIQSEVLAAVRTMLALRPQASLIIAGHSLGASMAVLGALIVKHHTGVRAKVSGGQGQTRGWGREWTSAGR